MISTILLVFAFVIFVLAAFNVPARFNLVAAGLAFWVLSILLGTWLPQQRTGKLSVEQQFIATGSWTR